MRISLIYFHRWSDYHFTLTGAFTVSLCGLTFIVLFVTVTQRNQTKEFMVGTIKYVPINYSHDAIVYLAAIVDGEGCLFIRKHHLKTMTHECNFAAKLEISNTDKRLMDWLVHHFGGRFQICGGKRTRNPKYSRAYRWVCESRRLSHICELIYPFSVIKKEQIEIILQFRQSCEKPTSSKGHCGIVPMTREEWEFRHSLYLKLRDLHT